MNQHQLRTLTMLHTVQAYMNVTIDDHPILANAGVARRRLDNVVAHLSTHFADQATATILLREAAQHQQSRRAKLLYRYVLPLSRIAHAELTEPEDQFALESFRMPRRHISVERLADVARGMAQAAVAHAGAFIAAGLPLDFIERLERATERMLETVIVSARVGARRAARTAAIQTLFAEARKLVDLIDAFVTAAFTGNHRELARWKATRRVHSSRGRKPALT